MLSRRRLCSVDLCRLQFSQLGFVVWVRIRRKDILKISQWSSQQFGWKGPLSLCWKTVCLSKPWQWTQLWCFLQKGAAKRAPNPSNSVPEVQPCLVFSLHSHCHCFFWLVPWVSSGCQHPTVSLQHHHFLRRNVCIPWLAEDHVCSHQNICVSLLFGWCRLGRVEEEGKCEPRKERI